MKLHTIAKAEHLLPALECKVVGFRYLFLIPIFSSVLSPNNAANEKGKKEIYGYTAK